MARGWSRWMSMDRSCSSWRPSLRTIARAARASARVTSFASRASTPRAIAAPSACLNPERTHSSTSPPMTTLILIAGVVFGVLVVLPMMVASSLRNVEAGTIRLVSWLAGGTVSYRGPGKSRETPLLTTGTTISSKVINVDLDITDQTADLDENGTPQPIKVRVLASAIASVGDSDQLLRTAANRFFSKKEADQINTLTDLLSSSGRRAINLLTHDQLFSAKATPSASKSLLGQSSPALPVKIAPAPITLREGDP